jgi:hypothetical protein
MSESQNLFYLDKRQKEEIERLEKIQSIKSQIFIDRVLEIKDRLRFFYLNEVDLTRIKIDQKIVVREKDETLLNRLRPQIETEGLIEPLTLLDIGNNQFLLLAGQHRYHVLRELGIDKAPAKIYLDLEYHEQLTLGYMSNEARKDPPAGKKYGALNNQYNELKKKLENILKREPSEFEVINEMYMTKNPKIRKLKTKEILIGMITSNLMYNPDSNINQYKFLSDGQVPKTKIVALIDKYHIENGKLEFPLLTSKNAFYGLTHLVRTTPITSEELSNGKDMRNTELKNVTTFLELLISKYIKPWMEAEPPEIDAAMNICKRHIFETLCKLIANRLRDRGFDIQTKDGTKAPLYTDKEIPWNSIFDDLEYFFKPVFLNHPNISKERSLDMLWNRCEYFVLIRPGRMPDF